MFNKRGAPTSRIYVAEQGIRIQNLSKTFQCFLWHFSVFTLEQKLKSITLLPLWWLLPLKPAHSLPEKVFMSQVSAFQICCRKLNFFGRTPPFPL